MAQKGLMINMEMVKVTKRTGSFNWCDPSEKQILYKFTGIPEEFCKDTTVTFKDEYMLDLELPEIDGTYTMLQFAKDLLAVGDRNFFYWYDRENVKKVIKYLGDHKQEQEDLEREAYRIELVADKAKLEKELIWINKMLDNWE
jgi:hypothetical protein